MNTRTIEHYTVVTTYIPYDEQNPGGWHVFVYDGHECIHNAGKRLFRTEEEALQNARRLITGMSNGSSCFLLQPFKRDEE